MGPIPKPLAWRLWSRVEKTDTCWLWTGFKTKTGYGQIGIPNGKKNGLIKRVHRVAWELTYGPIPANMYVLHKCDNPACVRPDHLFLGTQADNIADAIKKGRMPLPHTRSHLTIEQALAIRHAPGKTAEVAAKYGVSRMTVDRIKKFVTWRHI